MLSVLAIIVPLIVLVIMIWKKVNIAVSAIVCTGLMALMSGLNIYDCLTNDYMEAFVGYIKNYWPLIFLGASFGKAMQLGGGAEDLANLLTSKLGTKFTIAVLCVTTLILSYGGVSCYVIVFVMYPIALNMFKNQHGRFSTDLLLTWYCTAVRRMRFRFRRSDTGSGNTGSKIPGNGYKSWCPSQDRISSLHHTGFPATQRRYGYCTCMLRFDP